MTSAPAGPTAMLPAALCGSAQNFPAARHPSRISPSNHSRKQWCTQSIPHFAARQHGRREAHSQADMKIILPRASALSSGNSSHGLLFTATLATATAPHPRQAFSMLNRPPPNYPGHVPLTHIERAGLAIGSGVMSFLNPYRGGKYLLSHPSSPPPQIFVSPRQA